MFRRVKWTIFREKIFHFEKKNQNTREKLIDFCC